MKSNWLFGSILIFCILFLTFGQSHAQQYSPQFQSLLNQVQQTYLSPRGETLGNLWNNYPTVLAALIGHALRQQIIHVQQNPSLNNQFMNLQREAQAYITQVAQTTPARLQDGGRFTPEGLWYLVNKAFQGQDDGWILQNFGVRTGMLPSVLAASPGPQPLPPPTGRPPFKEEEPPSGDSIDLLGKQAPPVKVPPTTPPPPPRVQRKLNPEAAQGIWWGDDIGKGAPQLKIWREGDTYLGMLMNKQGSTFGGWKRNEVCFRVKYIQQEGEYLIFKGKHNEHIGNPYDNFYEWREYSAHYWVTPQGKERWGYYWSLLCDTFERSPRR